MALSGALERAGLVRNGLFHVSGDLVLRYNDALERITGKRASLTEFRVDKRGESPEICEELGDPYLQIGAANRFMIIVSPEQRNARLIHPETTFDEPMMDRVHRDAALTIEDVTVREPLYGELDNKVDLYARLEDLLMMNSVEVRLETPNGTLEKIHALKKKSLALQEHLLDDEYINWMLALVAEVGDIRQRDVACIKVRQQVGSFFARYFEGTFVYRKVQGASRGASTLVVYQAKDANPASDDAVEFIRFTDPNMLSRLMHADLVQLDPLLALQRRRELEDILLLAKGYDVVAMRPEDRKRSVYSLGANMPESWVEYRDVEQALGKSSPSKHIQGVLGRASEQVLRSLLVSSRKDAAVTNVLLSRLYPQDWRRTFEHNVRDVEWVMDGLPPHQQKYIIAVIKGTYVPEGQ